jgi:hypothetical protein
MSRAASVEDHKLNAAFESLRKAFAAPKYAERKEKPLAFWALPNDRRLPMALLGFPLKEILARPLDELAATPGIGKKKLHSLMKLLQRALKEAPGAPLVADESAVKEPRPKAKRPPALPPGGFDRSVVSELLWERWRETVRKNGLEQQTLGRLAPNLERLPTVIWRTPLGEYLDLTLAEIRQLKTHGEKRLAAVLEVFHGINQTIGGVPSTHLRVDLRPRFTLSIERWARRTLGSPRLPGAADVKENLVVPMLEQLRLDAGLAIARLLEERLGVKGTPVPVQQQSKRIGVTRARVYQLLETCADVMAVRWPEGEELFARLLAKLRESSKASAQLAVFQALTDIVYPALRESPKGSRIDLAASPGGGGKKSSGRAAATQTKRSSRSANGKAR